MSFQWVCVQRLFSSPACHTPRCGRYPLPEPLYSIFSPPPYAPSSLRCHSQLSAWFSLRLSRYDGSLDGSLDALTRPPVKGPCESVHFPIQSCVSATAWHLNRASLAHPHHRPRPVATGKCTAGVRRRAVGPLGLLAQALPFRPWPKARRELISAVTGPARCGND